MKKISLLVASSFVIGLAYADHLALKGTDKLDFIQKRLTMVEAQLTVRKGELDRLIEDMSLQSSNLNTLSIDNGRLSAIKKEVVDLETMVDIMKNSLQALNSLLQ